MKINTVRLLFEQSGTFKSVFNELGYKAYDYDIDNQFNQTNFQIDLFNEIDNAYNNKPSIFDDFNKDDLILAFFPCTYFSVQNELIWSRKVYNFKTWSEEKITKYIENRKREREKFFQTLLKFISVINKLKLRTVIENPFQGNYLLTRKEIKYPDIVILNRREYGDYYKKPTMFYFYNFEPSFISQYHIINKAKIKQVSLSTKGITRSLIHKDFAKNFVLKFILGI